MKGSDGSRIFGAYRALGFVCDHLPLVLRRHRIHKENYAATSVGRAFHVYKVSKLAIVSVSDLHDADITAIAADDFLVFTAAGKVVRAFKRGRHVIKTYSGHVSDVHLLLPFGPHLVSIDESSLLIVWDVDAQSPYLQIQFSNESFHVSSILHPSTYINKILLGSHQGAMQLWNIRTNKMVHFFAGWGAPVTVLAQAPAVDVVAVGLADGRILVHNLRQDATLMTFTHEGGPVTCVTFRTDGAPVMLSASASGSVAVWDLEEKRLLGQIDQAHGAAISSIQCLQGEPLMISNASDNSLKVWIFDLPDGTARVLRQRSYHSVPPSRIQFYGSNSTILSAGQDATLRCLSTVHEKYSKSLGRASFNKKMSKKLGLKKDTYAMPPMKEFCAVPTRESDWDSIVCIHSGLGVATTWNFERGTMGSHRLLHDRFADRILFPRATSSCLTITACGNFALIGYSTGHLDVFNLQSGIHRGSFGEPLAHDGTVRGVAVDDLNRSAASGGADAKLKFWFVKSRKLATEILLSSPVALMRLQTNNSLLVVAQDDFSIVVFDFDTKRLVRRLANGSFMTQVASKIMDAAFSPDGRWVSVACLDATLTTWDLASGSAVDCVRMESAVTSLSFSPDGDFLATTHADDLGVYLWSNLTLFSRVNLRPLAPGFSPPPIVLPTTSRHKPTTQDDDIVEEEEEDDVEGAFQSPAQIADDLVTLSQLPNSRWQHLLQLDVIKRRNKPKEPVKVPKNAPFFLPTIPNLEGHVQFGEMNVDAKEKEVKSPTSNFFENPLSPFAKQLLDSQESKDYEKTMSMLKEMGPTAIDSELSLLSPDNGGSLPLCSAFLAFASASFASRRDFELVNAYLGVFLAKCGDFVAGDDALAAALDEVRVQNGAAWNDVEHQIRRSLCVAKFLRSATL